MTPLRVCIDARFNGSPGGIAQVVMGLAHGLATLTDGDEEYVFLATEQSAAWIAPHAGDRCRIQIAPSVLARRAVASRVLDAVKPLRTAWDALSPLLGRCTYRVPRSDGAIEATRADVVHFPLQQGCLTSVPSVYQPHDLQHRHLPGLFSRREVMTRDILLQTLCRQAAAVGVTSSWVKADLVRQFQLPPERIHVIPLAPATAAYEPPGEAARDRCRLRHQLPDSFLFYPAHTFPHKNHLRLLEALVELDARHGLRPALVCSGGLTDHARHVDARIRALNLQDRVRMLGYVDAEELQCLYGLCSAVVIPTLFEAASFPLWETFRSGRPAACANVTSLPRQAADAAMSDTS